MSRMFAPDPHCKEATVGRSGRTYTADRRGFIHVDSAKDATRLKEAGYVQAGSTPATRRKWVCKGCRWEALINSCPHCHRTDLTRQES